MLLLNSCPQCSFLYWQSWCIVLLLWYSCWVQISKLAPFFAHMNWYPTRWWKNISVIFVVQSIRTPGGAFLMVSSFASQSWLFSPTIIAPAPATLLRNEESCGRIDSLSLLMIDLFSFVHNNKSSFLFLILLHRDIKSLYGASTTSTSIMIRPTSWVAGAMVSVVLNI